MGDDGWMDSGEGNEKNIGKGGFNIGAAAQTHLPCCLLCIWLILFFRSVALAALILMVAPLCVDSVWINGEWASWGKD